MKVSLILFFCCLSSLQAGAITIVDPWVKAVAPTMKMSAAYMVLKNSGEKDRVLVSATSPAAEHVEIHTHQEVKGVMKMRQIKSLTIKANSSQTLRPKGLHLMLIQLKQKLKDGEQVPITLTFADGKTQRLTAPVKKLK